jgi:hypothetical protein
VLDLEPEFSIVRPPIGERGLTPGRARHSTRRKQSGTFYTPRALAEFVVRRTLAPLVTGRSADDILALRIVDPAMGSGRFSSRRAGILLAAEQALIDEGRTTQSHSMKTSAEHPAAGCRALRRRRPQSRGGSTCAARSGSRCWHEASRLVSSTIASRVGKQLIGASQMTSSVLGRRMPKTISALPLLTWRLSNTRCSELSDRSASRQRGGMSLFTTVVRRSISGIG